MNARLQLNCDVPATESPKFVSLAYEGRREIRVGNEQEVYHVYRRFPEEPWSVVRLEEDRLAANFQGNPLWPALVLKDFPTLAAHFGLSGTLDGTSCLIPDVGVINKRLAELSQCTDRSAHFGFLPLNEYPLDQQGKISDETYVKKFIHEGVLPFDAVDRRDAIHDWSYHFMTMLFKPFLISMRENINLVIKKARLDEHDRWWEEVNYSWNYFGHTLNERGQFTSTYIEEKMTKRAAVYRQLAICLDSNCAKIAQFLKVSLDGLADRARQASILFSTFFCEPSKATIQQFIPREQELQQLILGDVCAEEKEAEDLLPTLWTILKSLEAGASVMLDMDILNERRRKIAELAAKVEVS